MQILPTLVEEPRKRSGLLRTSLAASTAAVVLFGAGAAYGVGHYLSGGGQQPEEVLPANAVAVVKLDLDPAFGQKKALYDLSRKLPGVKAKGVGSLKDDLLRSLFPATKTGMSYDRDIKPWLGDRVAIAAVPDTSRTGFSPVAAVQFTDKDKARKALRLAAIRASTTDPFAFTFTGDYALIAKTQAAADRDAAASTHLSDISGYKRAGASLDGDQIAVAWADLKRVYAAVPKALGTSFLGVAKPTGAVVIGVHADSHFLEVQGRSVDGGGLVTAGKGGNLLASFPDDTAVALEATGLGTTVTKAFGAVSKTLAPMASRYALHLPGDLGVLLGDDLAVGAFGDLTASSPTVAARVRTRQPARALAVLDRIAAAGDAPPFTTKTEAGGYRVGTDPAAIAALSTGHLGQTASFMRALPDAGSASMAVYLSFANLPVPRPSDLKGLDALGVTVDGASGSFRLRLTVR